MKVSVEEAVAKIEELVTHYKSINATFESLSEVFSDTSGPLFNGVWQCFDFAIKQTAETISTDSERWICWYIWDNECGKNGLELKSWGGKMKVKTVKQLVLLIEWYEEMDSS